MLNSATTYYNNNGLSTPELGNSAGNGNVPAEKEFHNIRCARHQHRGSTSHSRNMNNSNNNNNINNSNNSINMDAVDSVPCHHSSVSSLHQNYSHKQSSSNSNHHNHNHNYNHTHHNYKHKGGSNAGAGSASAGANGNGNGNECNHNHNLVHSQKSNHYHNHHNHHHNLHHSEHRKKTESVLSADSDLRFTRRKLGSHQKCGCALIAGFLVSLLIVGAIVYIGCKFFNGIRIE